MNTDTGISGDPPDQSRCYTEALLPATHPGDTPQIAGTVTFGGPPEGGYDAVKIVPSLPLSEDYLNVSTSPSVISSPTGRPRASHTRCGWAGPTSR